MRLLWSKTKKQKQHRRIRDFFFNKFLYKYHDIGIKGEKTRPARVAFYLKRIYYGLFPSWLVEHRYRKVISLPLKEFAKKEQYEQHTI